MVSRWLRGDCLSFARALQRALGPGAVLWDVVEPTPASWGLAYPGVPHHVVVRWRGLLYDAEGEHADTALLRAWTERAGAAKHQLCGPLVLEPHSARRAREVALRSTPSAVAEAADLAREVARAAGAGLVAPRARRYKGPR